MDRKDVMYEIIHKAIEQQSILDYENIEEFLMLLNDDLLKQLYIYFCLNF